MRIHLFEALGAGATTLGRYVAAHLALSYFDTDDYYREPTPVYYAVRRAPTTRNAGHNAWRQLTCPILDLSDLPVVKRAARVLATIAELQQSVH